VARKKTAENSIEKTSFGHQTRRGRVFLAVQHVEHKVLRDCDVLGGGENESKRRRSNAAVQTQTTQLVLNSYSTITVSRKALHVIGS